MFLDEKIYRAGIDTLKKEDDIAAIMAMINICFDETGVLREFQDDRMILPTFKRINTAWNMAIKKQRAEGVNFVKENGFLLFLLHSKEFKFLHDIINTILKSN